MASQIAYNSKTVTFARGFIFEDIRIVAETNRGKTISGAIDHYLVRKDVVGRFEWNIVIDSNRATDTTLRRQLEQWFSWAQNGLAWTFAVDSTKASSTTLNGAVIAGASSVIVNSASGFSIGDKCVIRTATKLDVVRITNIAGTTISLDETLNFAFPDAATFRHEKYWNAWLRDPERDVRFIDRFPDLKVEHYGFSLQFEEVAS